MAVDVLCWSPVLYSQVSVATHSKIGFRRPQIPFTGPWSSDESQGLGLKTGNQDDSPSDGRKGRVGWGAVDENDTELGTKNYMDNGSKQQSLTKHNIKNKNTTSTSKHGPNQSIFHGHQSRSETRQPSWPSAITWWAILCADIKSTQRNQCQNLR